MRLTVGLEIHAELKTVTKMFCSCRNDPGERSPNRNICPVCMAHPGTLPVINQEAVRKVLLVGKALGGQLADYTEFDRKNYFYPDIPKGYQLSQYEFPLVRGGLLGGVAVTRIHLEEDTARSQHEGQKSLVDYNRAGVPLMELVTEPVITDPAQAGAFARELQLLLRSLGAGEANMEKGEMRVEANISVSPEETLGTKVEVKNLNSFRSVERAIRFEFERQKKLIEEGGGVVQETRGWDEAKQQTFSQRKKESSHDYRYFPDPDLPPLRLSEIGGLADVSLPELPWERRARYAEDGISAEYTEMFISDRRFGELYERAAALAPEYKKLISNYIGSDLAGLAAKFGEDSLARVSAEGLAVLVKALSSGELSSRGAKDALAEAFGGGGELAEIFKKYSQQSESSALEAIAKQVITEHAGVAADFKAGKEAAMQFLVGQGMKASKGSANPGALREALLKVLG